MNVTAVLVNTGVVKRMGIGTTRTDCTAIKRVVIGTGNGMRCIVMIHPMNGRSPFHEDRRRRKIEVVDCDMRSNLRTGAAA
jgi:hypothetical protein